MKKLSKVLSLLLIWSMMEIFIPNFPAIMRQTITVSAAETPESNFTWNATVANQISGYTGTDPNVVIPSRCTSIDNFAFRNNTTITSVIIPSSVTKIGIGAFCDSSNLSTVTVPSSVTYVGNDAFKGTPWLDNNTNEFVLAGTNLIKYNRKQTSVVIPDGVTSIGFIPDADIIVTGVFDEHYANYNKMASLVISNSVTTIGSSSFTSCFNLKSLTIPSSVTRIGDSAFASCTGLTSVTLSSNITSISNSLFNNCSSLTSVVIPNSVTSIGDSAFADCNKLTSITIPNSVTNIKQYAFGNDSSLTSITLGNGVTTIGQRAFENNSISSIIIPSSVTTIDYGAFGNCPLTKIYVLGKTQEAANALLSQAAVSGRSFPESKILTGTAATEGIAADQSIAAAKALVPDSLTATKSTDTNLLTKLSAISGMSATGVTLTLESSNANVANDGTITYTTNAVTGNVVVRINKTNGTEDTKTISVTIPGETTSIPETTSISSAKALLPNTLTATKGTDTSILTMLNAISGMSATGTALTLVSSNANVANDGTITYTTNTVTGNVVVHINKTGETEDIKTIAVTIPATTSSGGDTTPTTNVQSSILNKSAVTLANNYGAKDTVKITGTFKTGDIIKVYGADSKGKQSTTIVASITLDADTTTGIDLLNRDFGTIAKGNFYVTYTEKGKTESKPLAVVVLAEPQVNTTFFQKLKDPSDKKSPNVVVNNAVKDTPATFSIASGLADSDVVTVYSQNSDKKTYARIVSSTDPGINLTTTTSSSVSVATALVTDKTAPTTTTTSRSIKFEIPVNTLEQDKKGDLYYTISKPGVANESKYVKVSYTAADSPAANASNVVVFNDDNATGTDLVRVIGLAEGDTVYVIKDNDTAKGFKITAPTTLSAITVLGSAKVDTGKKSVTVYLTTPLPPMTVTGSGATAKTATKGTVWIVVAKSGKKLSKAISVNYIPDGGSSY